MKKILGICMLAMAALGASVQAGEGMPGKSGHGPGRGHARGDGPGMGMGFPHPKMLQELGLSEEQQKKIKDQRLASQKKKIQLHGEKAMLELDLQNALSTHPVKEAEALKIAEKIAEVEKKTLLLRVESMSRFLASLTPEQHRKMMEHQAEMREKRKAWRDEMQKGWRRGNRDKDKDKDEDGKAGR